MSRYQRKLAAFETRAAMVVRMVGDLADEGNRLLNLNHALKLAFEERMCRQYRTGDEFTEDDEHRADELLALLPGGDA